MAVLNGEFETDVSGWAAAGGGSLTRQTTTYHAGAASANVTTGAGNNTGVIAAMTGDGVQNGTYDASAYLQAHGAGDVGKVVRVVLDSSGGVYEAANGTPVTLVQNGWQQSTVTFTFLNASHTAANVNIMQVGAGAAFNVDVDTVVLARHLAYLPSASPQQSGLWLPGIPAGNYSEPSDARTAQLIASGLYTGA